MSLPIRLASACIGLWVCWQVWIAVADAINGISTLLRG